MSEGKITDRPWPKPEYDNHGNGSYAEWWEIPGIARVYNKEDAEFIHGVANSHDQLVEALKKAKSVLIKIPPSISGHAEAIMNQALVEIKAALKAAGEEVS